MQALNRAGVEFDMRPTCRGVWLDRGELEKIIQGASHAEPPAPQRAAPAPPLASQEQAMSETLEVQVLLGVVCFVACLNLVLLGLLGAKS